MNNILCEATNLSRNFCGAKHPRKLRENRLFRVISRNSRAMFLLFSWFCCILSSVQGADFYYTNRTFKAITFNLQGTPPADMLNTESKKLNNIVNGSIKTNSYYALEQKTVFAWGYPSGISAWGAVSNFGSSPSNYSGKLFDNVGWARGTKSAGTNWGAFLWTMQNHLDFKSSETNTQPYGSGWVMITNVMVRGLTNYPPMTDQSGDWPDVGWAKSNYPGDNQGEEKTFQVDLTTYFQLAIPDISVSPPEAVAAVGGSAVQFTAVGTNIENGVAWSIDPSGVTSGATIQAGGYSASVTPGAVPQVYKIRAAVSNCPDFYKEAKLTVVQAEIKKVEFTSDHGVLTDYNTDYAGSGGTVYNPRGWIKDGDNNPITHVKDNNITVNVTVCVQPSGINFNLTGDGPISALDFHKTGLTSSGSDQPVSIASDEKLPLNVDVLSNSISWTFSFAGLTNGNKSSGPHKIYITWGSPGSGPTLKRIDKVCNTADDQDNPESIADSLQDMVASETDFGTDDVDGWALLDRGGSGDCDNQARCMKYTFEMLGAGNANVQFVRASTNAGTGNCLDYQSRTCSVHGLEYLLLDFYGGGQPDNMNQYEGCCEAAGLYYAITPNEKADDDYDMLTKLGDLGATQRWCWFDNTIGWFRGCDQSGSSPPIP